MFFYSLHGILFIYVCPLTNINAKKYIPFMWNEIKKFGPNYPISPFWCKIYKIFIMSDYVPKYHAEAIFKIEKLTETLHLRDLFAAYRAAAIIIFYPGTIIQVIYIFNVNTSRNRCLIFFTNRRANLTSIWSFQHILKVWAKNIKKYKSLEDLCDARFGKIANRDNSDLVEFLAPRSTF